MAPVRVQNPSGPQPPHGVNVEAKVKMDISVKAYESNKKYFKCTYPLNHGPCQHIATIVELNEHFSVHTKAFKIRCEGCGKRYYDESVYYCHLQNLKCSEKTRTPIINPRALAVDDRRCRNVYIDRLTGEELRAHKESKMKSSQKGAMTPAAYIETRMSSRESEKRAIRDRSLLSDDHEEGGRSAGQQPKKEYPLTNGQARGGQDQEVPMELDEPEDELEQMDKEPPRTFSPLPAPPTPPILPSDRRRVPAHLQSFCDPPSQILSDMLVLSERHDPQAHRTLEGLPPPPIPPILPTAVPPPMAPVVSSVRQAPRVIPLDPRLRRTGSTSKVAPARDARQMDLEDGELAPTPLVASPDEPPYEPRRSKPLLPQPPPMVDQSQPRQPDASLAGSWNNPGGPPTDTMDPYSAHYRRNQRDARDGLATRNGTQHGSQRSRWGAPITWNQDIAPPVRTSTGGPEAVQSRDEAVRRPDQVQLASQPVHDLRQHQSVRPSSQPFNHLNPAHQQNQTQSSNQPDHRQNFIEAGPTPARQPVNRHAPTSVPTVGHVASRGRQDPTHRAQLDLPSLDLPPMNMPPPGFPQPPTTNGRPISVLPPSQDRRAPSGTRQASDIRSAHLGSSSFGQNRQPMSTSTPIAPPIRQQPPTQPRPPTAPASNASYHPDLTPPNAGSGRTDKDRRAPTAHQQANGGSTRRSDLPTSSTRQAPPPSTRQSSSVQQRHPDRSPSPVPPQIASHRSPNESGSSDGEDRRGPSGTRQAPSTPSILNDAPMELVDRIHNIIKYSGDQSPTDNTDGRAPSEPRSRQTHHGSSTRQDPTRHTDSSRSSASQPRPPPPSCSMLSPAPPRNAPRRTLSGTDSSADEDRRAPPATRQVSSSQQAFTQGNGGSSNRSDRPGSSNWSSHRRDHQPSASRARDVRHNSGHPPEAYGDQRAPPTPHQSQDRSNQLGRSNRQEPPPASRYSHATSARPTASHPNPSPIRPRNVPTEDQIRRHEAEIVPDMDAAGANMYDYLEDWERSGPGYRSGPAGEYGYDSDHGQDEYESNHDATDHEPMDVDEDQGDPDGQDEYESDHEIASEQANHGAESDGQDYEQEEEQVAEPKKARGGPRGPRREAIDEDYQPSDRSSSEPESEPEREPESSRSPSPVGLGRRSASAARSRRDRSSSEEGPSRWNGGRQASRSPAYRLPAAARRPVTRSQSAAGREDTPPPSRRESGDSDERNYRQEEPDAPYIDVPRGRRAPARRGRGGRAQRGDRESSSDGYGENPTGRRAPARRGRRGGRRGRGGRPRRAPSGAIGRQASKRARDQSQDDPYYNFADQDPPEEPRPKTVRASQPKETGYEPVARRTRSHSRDKEVELENDDNYREIQERKQQAAELEKLKAVRLRMARRKPTLFSNPSRSSSVQRSVPPTPSRMPEVRNPSGRDQRRSPSPEEFGPQEGTSASFGTRYTRRNSQDPPIQAPPSLQRGRRPSQDMLSQPPRTTTNHHIDHQEGPSSGPRRSRQAERAPKTPAKFIGVRILKPNEFPPSQNTLPYRRTSTERGFGARAVSGERVPAVEQPREDPVRQDSPVEEREPEPIVPPQSQRRQAMPRSLLDNSQRRARYAEKGKETAEKEQ